MLKNFLHSKKMFFVTIFGMYGIMLIFNILTQKIGDDYTYCFSFLTLERITCISDIWTSIIEHGKVFNGRYFSHFLVQLFLLMPDIVFDILNAGVFVATIYIVYKICNGKNEINNLFLIGIFGFVWIFENDFGQVNLWLDGSCNYLFAIFFALLFIIPYINSFMLKKKIHIGLLIPHFILSVWVGGYLETVTVGFVCAACLFVIADVCLFKNYRALSFIPSIIGSLLGFAITIFAPAQSVNKLSDFTFGNMLWIFCVALLVVALASPLILIYIFLFKRALKENMDRKIIMSSLVLVISALASNFVHVFAKYYALRSSIAFVFLLIFATALLYGNLKNRDFGLRAKKYYKLFAILLCFVLIVGIVDNTATFIQIEHNEQIIEDALNSGETRVELYRPIPITKYNAVWGLMYLNIQSVLGYPNEYGWPNPYMAEYYGLEFISGKSRMCDLFDWWWKIDDLMF